MKSAALAAAKFKKELNDEHHRTVRHTNYSLNPGDELNDLRMSEGVRPLYDRVRKFIGETVEPISAEIEKLLENAADRWSFTPARSLRPRQRACGTSSYPMLTPATE